MKKRTSALLPSESARASKPGRASPLHRWIAGVGLVIASMLGVACVHTVEDAGEDEVVVDQLDEPGLEPQVTCYTATRIKKVYKECLVGYKVYKVYENDDCLICPGLPDNCPSSGWVLINSNYISTDPC